MLKGFALLLLFQCLGLLFVSVFHLPVPGPVLGMMLLLAYCLCFTPSQDLQTTSQGLLAYLPLFILPASAGIVNYGELMRSAWLPISLALVVSLIISFCVTPYIFRGFLKLFGARQ